MPVRDSSSSCVKNLVAKRTHMYPEEHDLRTFTFGGHLKLLLDIKQGYPDGVLDTFHHPTMRDLAHFCDSPDSEVSRVSSE